MEYGDHRLGKEAMQYEGSQNNDIDKVFIYGDEIYFNFIFPNKREDPTRRTGGTKRMFTKPKGNRMDLILCS